MKLLNILSINKGSSVDTSNEIKEEPPVYKLIFITYGKYKFTFKEQKYISKKGDILLFSDPSQFSDLIEPYSFHEKYVVTFHSSIINLPILENEFLILQSSLFHFLLDRLKEILREQDKQLSYFDYLSSALLVEVLSLLNREVDSSPKTSESIKYVDKMKKYIEENYQQQITKLELSDLINKTPNYSIMLFSKGTGSTVSNYLHEVRIKKGLFMLLHSELSIKEIAIFLGYRDVSYFNKVFKRKTGRTPSSFLEDRKPDI